jgi:hypothetical protein
MGSLSELGLDISESNRVQRSMQHIVASKPGAWLFSKFLHGVDKPLFRLSKGRVTLPSILAGLPVVMLTTTGRKSGEPRTMPLLGIPSGDNVVVIGSNFDLPRISPLPSTRRPPRNPSLRARGCRRTSTRLIRRTESGRTHWPHA